MDQRESSRCIADLDVVIDYRGLGMVRGRALNISHGGMFVETGRVQLPMHAVVDAALIAGGSGARPRALRFKAVVVQQKAAGIGLQFSQLDADAEAFLTELAAPAV